MNTNSPMPLLRSGPEGLELEGVRLSDIATRFGTPTYVYSLAAMSTAFEAYRAALGGRHASICYAVKANSNLGILSAFARLGAGFDIVSGGELERVIAAGGDPARTVFSGVGKRSDEMTLALDAGIRCFNVESAAELERLNEVAARACKIAPIALRVNPDVDPRTHPYISTGLRNNKFGVAFEEALGLYRHAASLDHVRITGIACHIGSQLLDPAPIAQAASRLIELIDALSTEAGIQLEHIDIGGGLGIRYRDEAAPSPIEYLEPVLELFSERKEEILLEPGRSLIGNAGLLLTRIEYLKLGRDRNFAIVDAAMNDLARPALYDAWHDIVAVRPHTQEFRSYDVVGPVCESGDFLGRDRSLAIAQGDLLAILSAGAYGMTMSSNYNTRPRAAEVIISSGQAHLVRRREPIASLLALESGLPDS